MQPIYENAPYHRLARYWLFAILVILPFQLKISAFVNPWSGKFSTLVNNLDELTIVLFFLPSIHILRKAADHLFFFYSYR